MSCGLEPLILMAQVGVERKYAWQAFRFPLRWRWQNGNSSNIGSI